ncbi:MAG: hypothetical protein A2V88_16190 [Elusimicrobia bacterium RBG_16_66_12]|nr:MAG: hypothetical protein A2V88_16190 [Elusimicrobia bacterium RBG_16_66_12]
MSVPAAFLLGTAFGAGLSAAAALFILRGHLRTCGRMLSFSLHELSTPITAINMTLVNLLSGAFGEIAPEQRKWIEMSQDQVARMSALLFEIRDFVHLELGRDLRVDIARVPAAEIHEDALAAHRRAFAHAGVELVVEAPKDLPLCRTDAQRAARSLAALVQHAKKFRIQGPVRVSVQRRGARVTFEVAYEGPIQSPGEAARSLELFYPARRRGDQVLSASGLGLGFVRLVIERLGGGLEFDEDVAGKGRLSLILPAEETA